MPAYFCKIKLLLVEYTLLLYFAEVIHLLFDSIDKKNGSTNQTVTTSHKFILIYSIIKK